MEVPVPKVKKLEETNCYLCGATGSAVLKTLTIHVEIPKLPTTFPCCTTCSRTLQRFRNLIKTGMDVAAQMGKLSSKTKSLLQFKKCQKGSKNTMNISTPRIYESSFLKIEPPEQYDVKPDYPVANTEACSFSTDKSYQTPASQIKINFLDDIAKSVGRDKTLQFHENNSKVKPLTKKSAAGRKQTRTKDKRKNRRGKCYFCHKLIATPSLKYHMQKHTMEYSSFNCDKCKKSFSLLDNLKRHRILVCGGGPAAISRLRSKEKQYTKTRQEKQAVQRSSQDKFQCYFCGNKYSRRSTLYHHLKKHTREFDDIRCRKCAARFSSKSYRRTHEILKCGIGTDEEVEKLKHRRTNSYLLKKNRSKTRAKITCKVCQSEFKTKYQLLLHTNSKCGTDEDLKKIYMKKLSEISRRHQRKQQQIVCEMCGIKVSSKHYLRQHQKLCEKGEVFKCRFCGENFLRKKDRLSHEKTQHVNQVLRCYFCSRHVTQTSHISGHIRTHTKEKEL